MATITGLFGLFENADRALHELEHLGYSSRDFGAIVPGKIACNYIDGRNALKETAAMPAITGAIMGGLTGLLAGVAPQVIPGIGPVVSAGALALTMSSTAAGAGFGAVSGGLLGLLVNLGIPELDAKIQLEGVQDGAMLLTVKTDMDRIDEIKEVLERNGAIDIETRHSIWERRTIDAENSSSEAMILD